MVRRLGKQNYPFFNYNDNIIEHIYCKWIVEISYLLFSKSHFSFSFSLSFSLFVVRSWCVVEKTKCYCFCWYLISYLKISDTFKELIRVGTEKRAKFYGIENQKQLQKLWFSLDAEQFTYMRSPSPCTALRFGWISVAPQLLIVWVYPFVLNKANFQLSRNESNFNIWFFCWLKNISNFDSRPFFSRRL